jgi:hypothetical protein
MADIASQPGAHEVVAVTNRDHLAIPPHPFHPVSPGVVHDGEGLVEQGIELQVAHERIAAALLASLSLSRLAYSIS